ncbi:MAG: bifunctional tetrahydrofolate synthase/dihydrofolate synthase [Gammaproteobacteria bacterium]|nr:bifunctional tetrahydrofolate synthase/dihydrofolate synthase [Gammaproteobacteria bacterium]
MRSSSQTAPARNLDQWLEYITATHPSEIEMGLARVRSVAARMQLLKPAPRSVIVAGTNGKGTTCVCLEQILVAAGLRVGCTLSPHVHAFNERVRINGRDLDDSPLCAAFEAVEFAREDTPLTYFEFTTLVALFAFREAEVDIAILEVGLGGRLDAFNVVDADVGIITSIGIDHTEYLGDNVEVIGGEKAGVLRSGQHIVLGPGLPQSVLRRAAELTDTVSELDRNVFYARAADSAWSLRFQDQLFDDLPVARLPLGNCALAIVAAHSLTTIDHVTVSRALRNAWLPGRLESFDAYDRTWLVDVAHNPLAAQFLQNELALRGLGHNVVAVFGALRDKDVSAMLSALDTVVRDWVVVDAPSARGLSASELAVHFEGLSATMAGSLDNGFEVARSLTECGDVILVFGSFGIAGSARRSLALVTRDE